jgi:protein TonB
VLAQFVVDTAGRVETSTFKVISSDDPAFTVAVRDGLPSQRFLPAEVSGRKVKQLVQQPFVFSPAP